MSLSSDINTTSTALADIKNAIVSNGVTPSGGISTYATAIGNIPTFYTVQQESDDYNLLVGADTVFSTITVSGTYASKEEAWIALGSTLFSVTEVE